MWSTAREIAAGDTIIVWLTRELVQPLVITPGKEFNGRFGVYSHSDLVGVPYGSKVASRNGKGFVHVLRPTPELWTMALPHRTQILYAADIAFIIAWLGIIPGSRVIEAGTGSGSFSHSVSRSIGSLGHLYSYEFHEARANKAREEFALHGMSDIVTLTHRNVCKDGFTVSDDIDAVFLDLPEPWEAVPHAKLALRKDRVARICCFSPCMEQVLRTVSALNDAGFTEITMYETLLRPHEVHQMPAMQPISIISAQLKLSEKNREEKRLQQIASARRVREGRGKRKRDVAEPPIKESNEDAGEIEPGGVKRVKTEDGIADTMPVDADEDAGAGETEAAPLSAEDLETADDPPPANSPTKVSQSKVMYEVRGHTSYLTFAVLLPTVHPGPEPALHIRDIGPIKGGSPDPAEAPSQSGNLTVVPTMAIIEQ